MKALKIALCSSLILTGVVPYNVYAQDVKIGEADTNLALRKNGVVSTTQDSGTPASEAFDGTVGDSANRWASAAGKDASGIDETWIYVDLGAEKDISKIVLNWESRPNKFKIQVSNDLNEWKDVTDTIDNGFYKDSQAAFPDAKAKNVIELDEIVTARYVKMQGIQRRREKNNDNNTGFSLYEFEVYGPAWSDDQYVDEYLTQLSVPAQVSKNFKLPIVDSEYGVHVSWKSDSAAIRIDENGNAVVTRSEQDQKVMLTAKVQRNEIAKEKQFEVLVKNVSGEEYDIYPLPHSIEYRDGEFECSGEVRLVFEDSVSEYTKGNYREMLEKHDIQYKEASSSAENGKNLIVGVKDGKGEADAYFEEKGFDLENSIQKSEGYVLDVDEDKNTVAVIGNSDAGAKYGHYTLDDIMAQSDGVIRELTVEDEPSTQFRGFIEGFYGAWSHENRKSLIEFGGKYKMNTYIYGPKNDEYHYGKWREPYPNDKLNELKELVDLGKKTGVEFVWAAHVGGHTDLSDKDIADLEKKFDQLYGIGVRQFAIFFDDSATDNTRLVEYMNKIQREYVDAKKDVKPLIFCPQYYNKKNGNEAYLKNIANFDERIQVMWTGDFVVSEINQSVIDYITNLIERPVYIWWNWPVNDLGRSHLMHLGPSEALQNDIQDMSGLVSNPMNQAQASKVALYSIADYSWNTHDYDSDASWHSALKHIITDDEEASKAFELFAQNCAAAPMSFSQTDESVYMKQDLQNLKDKFINQEDFTKEAEIVKNHFSELKNAINVLRDYQGTNGLVKEISPWLDVTYDIADAGEYVVSNLALFNELDKTNDASIEQAKKIIEEGKQRLAKSNTHSGKKCSQKVLYPFVEDMLSAMEEKMYLTLDIHRKEQGFGSIKKDYTNALDHNTSTNVVLGQYIENDYFAVDLGKEMHVSDIEIQMEEKKDKKFAYYKKGVLEYSLDKQTWTPIGEYAGPNVKDTMDITARYIRYRATELHENINTGENLSDVVLTEFLINEQSSVTVTNDDKNLKLQANKKENVVSLTGNEDSILKSGSTIYVSMNTLKNLMMVHSEMEGIQIEISKDGLTWDTMKPNVFDNKEVRYVRISNPTQEDIVFSPIEIRFAGKVAANAALTTNSGDIYSGNANNVVDGNEATTLWLKRGDNGNSELTRYLEFDLNDVTALHDMEVVFSGDNTLNGRVDISSDKKNWETVYTFDKVGKERQTIELHNEEARYVRYYMSNGNWIQIKEVYFNKLLDENVKVVEGDVEHLEEVVDGNIFTGITTPNKAGQIVLSSTGMENPKELVLFKNSGSKVKVEVEVVTTNGKSTTKWIDLGTYDKVFNRIDLSAYDVINARISWEANTNAQIFELYFNGQKKVDKTKLQHVLSLGKEIKDSGRLDTVDEELRKAFEKAYVYAENVALSDTVTQVQVNEAQNELQACIDKIIVNKDKLKKVIEEVEALDYTQYTKDSTKELPDLLKTGKELLKDEKASQETVDEMVAKLQTALEGLEENASELKAYREAVVKEEASKYTEESYEKYLEAYNALMALEEGNTSKKVFEEVKTAYENAKAQLVEKSTAPITPEKPNDDKEDGVNTGDRTAIMSYTLGLAVSGLALGGIVLRKKKRGEIK